MGASREGQWLALWRFGVPPRWGGCAMGGNQTVWGSHDPMRSAAPAVAPRVLVCMFTCVCVIVCVCVCLPVFFSSITWCVSLYFRLFSVCQLPPLHVIPAVGGICRALCTADGTVTRLASGR